MHTETLLYTHLGLCTRHVGARLLLEAAGLDWPANRPQIHRLTSRTSRFSQLVPQRLSHGSRPPACSRVVVVSHTLRLPSTCRCRLRRRLALMMAQTLLILRFLTAPLRGAVCKNHVKRERERLGTDCANTAGQAMVVNDPRGSVAWGGPTKSPSFFVGPGGRFEMLPTCGYGEPHIGRL